MSSLLSAELSAACSALGYLDPKTNTYHADRNTLETAKDLIRYLRRDDETHEIRRHLGETQVLQSDLLPLLKTYWEQEDLFDVLLRLLVNLTSPALVLWAEETPSEKTARNHFLQVEEHLQKYKQAFADGQVWAVLSAKLSKILEVDFAERGEENSLVIERILILIRNVLYVPADPDLERRPDDDASVHDQVLWALHQSGTLDIILFVAGSPNERPYYMHIIEIMSFMLREQSATELANAALQRSESDKLRDEAELLAVKHRESNQRQQRMKMYSGARHSRFGGTFVVKSMKSIGTEDLVYHKPLNRINSISYDIDKKIPKTPRNRCPVKAADSERRSAFSIRLFLKEFCIEFLNGAYNTFMYQVKDNLVRAKAQTHDESYYLWAVRFFMEFNRGHKFEVALVSETMSVQAFYFVQKQMENYFDMIESEKRKATFWPRRLHLAVLAYRELLLTLCSMTTNSDEEVRNSANIIQSNIFYVVEYRELILTLLVTFDEFKMSQLYLRDLMETQHIFLKMFEAYCSRRGNVVVQKKGGARKKKKRQRQEQQQRRNVSAVAAAAAGGGSREGDGENDGVGGNEAVPAENNLHGRWDELAPQLSAVLEGDPTALRDDAAIVPFDAASDVPIDEQKSAAMIKIQRNLRDGELETALGLLRAAREVWPENDSFGSPFMAPEEELAALRDIYFADLGLGQDPISSSRNEDAAFNQNDDFDEQEEEELEGMDDEGPPETTLNFKDFIMRLCNKRVMNVASIALENFESNTVYTNHCVIKLMHRIAWDLKMSSFMFQATVFRTFQKIYAAKDLPQYKELVKFATYVLRQFFTIASKNPLIFMETLFWKTASEAVDIENGYGSYHEQSKRAAASWSDLEEEELRRLFEEHAEKEVSQDVVDWIVGNLINNERTRRGVLKKLKEMELLSDYKGRRPVGKSGSGGVPRTWGPEEEEQLVELFEQFKESDDIVGNIMECLNVRRPKNRIVEKLLVLGLIQDKKEVRKKRAKKNKSGDATETNDVYTDSSSDEDSVSTHHRPPPTARPALKKQRPTTSKQQKPRPKRTARSRGVPEIIAALRKIVDMKEALEWIRESLTDLAEDLEDVSNEPNDDENDGVPLVSYTEATEQAMENRDFRAFLESMGIGAPIDEQETFWRIPTNIEAAALRQNAQLITDALEGTLESVATPSAVPTPSDDDEDDDNLFDRLRQSMTSVSSEGANSNIPKENAQEISRPKNKRAVVESDSEEENRQEEIGGNSDQQLLPEQDVNGENFESNDNQQEMDLKTVENNKRVLSDSESEDEEVVVQKNKRIRTLISDDEDE